MPAKKRPTRKPAKKKPTRARKKRATTRGSRRTVEELVHLQQQAVGRIADLWANAADRAAKGNFGVAQWVTDYTELWGGLTDDYSKAVKLIFRTKR